MAYDFKPESGFRMLHADRHSRPICQCTAIQNHMPSQATVAAVDQKGRALFLAPEPETYGPERNMYTAAQYYLGQAPAGIVQGNLKQRPRDDDGDGDAEPSQSAVSSSSLNAGSHAFCFSSSALPVISADSRGLGGAAEGSGEGASSASAVRPPETSGRAPGMTCFPYKNAHV